jgi:hypothetical protein
VALPQPCSEHRCWVMRSMDPIFEEKGIDFVSETSKAPVALGNVEEMAGKGMPGKQIATSRACRRGAPATEEHCVVGSVERQGTAATDRPSEPPTRRAASMRTVVDHRRGGGERFMVDDHRAPLPGCPRRALLDIAPHP